LVFAAVLMLSLPKLSAAQSSNNFCPDSIFGGTCDIANPVYMNVYWDSSKSQWDQDEIAAGQEDMVSGRIDALTQAITHSNYFRGLSGYSVASVTLLPSIASDCIPVPTTIDKALQQLTDYTRCILAANPNLDPGNAILNVFLPSKTVPSSPTSDYCLKYSASHNKFGYDLGLQMEVSMIPANVACNFSISALFTSLTHEMVEGTTDPVPMSPTGWKPEIGDICKTAAAPQFLYAAIQAYWVDGIKACFGPTLLSVPPAATPSIAVSSISGGGSSTVFSLTGPSLAGAPVGPPWDLAGGNFGGQTLYLQASILHPGQASWGAGNIEGVPPDQVGFGPVSWSDNGTRVSITANGFSGNYGGAVNESFSILPLTGLSRAAGLVTAITSMPNNAAQGAPVVIAGATPADLNGAFQVLRTMNPTVFLYIQTGNDEIGGGGKAITSTVATLAPGDTINFTYSDPLTGLSTTASGSAPFPAMITAALDESRPQHPTVQDSEQISGVISDAQGRGMQGLSVSCSGCAAPAATQTANSGAFFLHATPGPVAGPQTVTLQTPGAQHTEVTTTLTNPVFPVLTSIDPAIGSVTGLQPVVLHGAGFDPAPGNTFVLFNHARASVQSVAANNRSVQMLTPPISPSSITFEGIVFVRAVVNGVTSAPLEYRYFVPGRPVLDFTWGGCDTHQVTANVYAADGSPVKVKVQFTAAYKAFLDASNNLTQRLTVPSGQAVTFVGSGPFVATNVQTPSLTVKESSTLPNVNLCSLGGVLHASIENAIIWNPSVWIPHPGPGCGDCPENLANSAVWTGVENVASADAYVIISGPRTENIAKTFAVHSVGIEEFQSYVRPNTLAAVRNAKSAQRLQFVGPAVNITFAGISSEEEKKSGDEEEKEVKKLKNLLRISFGVPSSDPESSRYRIVRLVFSGKTPAWAEYAATEVQNHGAAVAVSTQEAGIYALARIVEH